MPRRADLTGLKFAEWTVLEQSREASGCWFCRCSCGVERHVNAANLRKGTSTSCGHLRRKERPAYDKPAPDHKPKVSLPYVALQHKKFD